MTTTTVRMVATLLILIGIAMGTPAFPVDGQQPSADDGGAALSQKQKAMDLAAIGIDQPSGQETSGETLANTAAVALQDADARSHPDARVVSDGDDEQGHDPGDDSSEAEEWLQDHWTETGE